MKIIFNADDFGLSEGVNKGIVESHTRGVVLSTTIMANAPAYQDAVNLSKQHPNLHVGIHLVATYGKPLRTDVDTLVDKSGNFKRLNIFETLDIDTTELYKEWCTQIERVSKDIQLSHFDSHHHIHLHPKLISVVDKISKKYSLPYRGTQSVKNISVALQQSFYKDKVSIETIRNLILNSEEDIDIMTHPAYLDESLKTQSSYYSHRYLELELLCSEELKDFLKENQIKICSYKSIWLVYIMDC